MCIKLGAVQRRLQKILADYLFRGGLLPSRWGLYITGIPEGIAVNPEVAVEIRSDRASNGDLLAVTAVIGAVAFTFAFGRLTTDLRSGAFAIHRPSAVCLYSTLSPAVKVLALSWDYARLKRAEAAKLRLKGARYVP